jgi:transposase InsO family protein
MIKEKQIPISKACESLKLSKSNYYDWAKGRMSAVEDKSLLKEIHSVACEFPCYGYRRMTHELRRRNMPINSKKVRKIMKQENLVCRRKKAFKPVTTDSNHGFRIYPNLAKDLIVIGLNQLWVSDITYVRLPHGFAYLATIEDVFSRKCIGWALGRVIDTALTLDALNMAIEKRWDMDLSNLIHHSDQGVQYASDAYTEMLNQFGIKISMSRRGNPYDNAFAESFNKTLKVEEVYINEYETFEDALKNIKHFIEVVYNKKRLHSSIGYVPPEEFEKEVLAKI